MDNKKELIISRIFKAKHDKVFDAWTNPLILKKWWGPKGFSCPVAKINFKVGGKYIYCMRGEIGKFKDKDFWSGGEYTLIDEPNKLVITDYFSDKNGNKTNPTDHGLSADFPKESTVTILFKEVKGKTKLSIIYHLPKSKKANKAIIDSQMELGWNSSLDKLQNLVEKN